MSECQSRTINQIFPVEILATVFSFINPSAKNIYPHLPLSHVCRLWHSIILENPKFWSILRYRCESQFYNKEIIQRSKSQKLHIFITLPVYYDPETQDLDVQDFGAYVNSESSRITSLFLRGEHLLRINWRDLAFPQLETLSLANPLPYESTVFCESLVKLIASFRLRHLALSVQALSIFDRLKALHYLTNVEWLDLKIRLDSGPALSRVFQILNTDMSNLQILTVSSRLFPFTFEAVTFPKVRILSLDLGHSLFPPFHAPNLDYLCVLHYGRGGFDNWSHLESFDFSQIKHLRVGLHTRMSYVGCIFAPTRFACVSGGGHTSPMDCTSFKKFHEEGMSSRVIAISNNNSSLPPRNAFHFPVVWNINTEVLLKRAPNLTELTLDYNSLKHHKRYIKCFSFIAQVLRGANTITALNIMHARGFVDACRLLTDGHIAPRLGRLTYHNSVLVKATAFLPRRVKMLQDMRLAASSQPIKILELKNFVAIPDERVKEIQVYGIRIVQS